jgi:hypothetical protein
MPAQAARRGHLGERDQRELSARLSQHKRLPTRASWSEIPVRAVAKKLVSGACPRAGTRFVPILSCILSYIPYVYLVETTLTIRLSAKHREALRRRAAAEKRSESALVRDLIDREINRGFDFNRVRHLVGSIAGSPKHWAKDPWRKHIRQRNWRR